MNVLMIDDRIPQIPMGAGYPRANALVHTLLPGCERLAFYPLVFPNECLESPEAHLDSRVELLHSRGYGGLPATLTEYAERGFDVVWVSRPENMKCVDAIFAGVPGLRDRFTIVYDAEALYAPRMTQLRALRGTPNDPVVEAGRLTEELELAARADILVSVSAHEAATFRARTGRPTFVLGFTSIPDATTAGFAARHDFGFAGGIRPDTPNEDSLLWYAANAMHAINARTGALLRVVGYVDSPWVMTYAGEEMVLHGGVASLRPFFEHIRVFIAPTRYAAGLPQKLIDAASAGVPIVATPILAQSMGWTHERELLVAQGADAFIETCVRLYDDAQLWARLRSAALTAVRAGFGAGIFEAQTAAIVAAIQALRDRRRCNVASQVH